MQFGVAAGQPEGVARGQGVACQGREEDGARAQCVQGLHVGGVDEGKGGVAGDGDRRAHV